MGLPVSFVSVQRATPSTVGRLFQAAALSLAVFLVPSAQAKEAPDRFAGASISALALPAEARATQQAIRVGGPFAAAKDGSVFGNRERHLALKPRGYYREYTVATPGVRSRGASRIVCGGTRPTEPEACFYTDDHYASFRRIVQ